MLVFRVGDSHYGVSYMNVDSIVAMSSVVTTAVPASPEWVVGIMNYRRELSILLGDPSCQDPHIVVLAENGRKVGFIVEQVFALEETLKVSEVWLSDSISTRYAVTENREGVILVSPSELETIYSRER